MKVLGLTEDSAASVSLSVVQATLSKYILSYLNFCNVRESDMRNSETII